MKKDAKVFFGGDLYYKNHIVELVKEKINLIEVSEIIESDIIYWIYGPGPDLKKYFKFWLSTHKAVLIIHWIGSDVLKYKNKYHQKKITMSKINFLIIKKLIQRKYKHNNLIHLAGAPWLFDELKELNIESRYFPLTKIDPSKYEYSQYNNNVKNIDFLSYLPQSRFDFYGGHEIFNIARILKNRKFIITVPDISDIDDLKIADVPDNVTLLPKVNDEEILQLFKKAKCFLRFTKHDGLSLSVLEALYFQLKVFWTYDFNFVNKAETKDCAKLAKQLDSCIEKWKPNIEGHKYILENFQVRSLKSKYEDLFLEL